MTEYISREALRKHLFECYTDEFFDDDMKKAVVGIDVYVENMPVSDAQPVKHGQWICEFYNDVFDVYQADCSVCKRESTDKYDKVSESYEYCPHCGAKMDVIYEDDKVRDTKVTGWGDDVRNLTDEETDIYNSWLEAEAETIDEISLL